jgi:hypothetical protein
METVLTVIDISSKTAEINDISKNTPLINDHVIRAGVTIESF